MSKRARSFDYAVCPFCNEIHDVQNFRTKLTLRTPYNVVCKVCNKPFSVKIVVGYLTHEVEVAE